MVRISDIFKKNKQNGAGLGSDESGLGIGRGVEAAVNSEVKKQEPAAKTEKTGTNSSFAVKSQILNEYSGKDIEALYIDLVKVIKNFYISVEAHGSKYFDTKIYEALNKIIDMFTAGDGRIMGMTNKVSIPEYLFSHTANVCILSLRLGVGLSYSRQECMEIGLSGIFHDLGLIRKSALINKVERLSEAELNEIKKHSVEGMRIINGFSFISDELKRLIANVVYQSHERLNGKGYPAGLKGENLHNYSQIIGLTDTYEALTHHRAYRGRFLPHDVCRWLVETREAGDEFNGNLIKKFLEVVGIYPIGSFVKLSSGEIAEVKKINTNYPLRPVVEVIVNIDQERQSPPRVIDLTANPVVQIAGPIDESKIKTKDAKFALFLLAKNWLIIE